MRCFSPGKSLEFYYHTPSILSVENRPGVYRLSVKVSVLPSTTGPNNPAYLPYAQWGHRHHRPRGGLWKSAWITNRASQPLDREQTDHIRHQLDSRQIQWNRTLQSQSRSLPCSLSRRTPDNQLGLDRKSSIKSIGAQRSTGKRYAIIAVSSHLFLAHHHHFRPCVVFHATPRMQGRKPLHKNNTKKQRDKLYERNNQGASQYPRTLNHP